MADTDQILRPHAEVQYADELAALDAADDRERPPNWRLSPWAVVTYLVGGELADGTMITPKYVGRRRLMEIAVATLATDRALLLLGVPGTAKTWVSEHLAAAISGNSTLLVQGTAGTTEETLRFFGDVLLSQTRRSQLDALTGCGTSQAERLLRRHLGVCLDEGQHADGLILGAATVVQRATFAALDDQPALCVSGCARSGAPAARRY